MATGRHELLLEVPIEGTEDSYRWILRTEKPRHFITCTLYRERAKKFADGGVYCYFAPFSSPSFNLARVNARATQKAIDTLHAECRPRALEIIAASEGGYSGQA